MNFKEKYEQNKLLFIGIAAILATAFITGTILIITWYRKRNEVTTTGSGPMKQGANNPLNIRNTANTWQGENTPDGSTFETFVSMPYGYRAGMVLLHNYVKGGTDTLRKIISKYAPPSDNNPTDAYIANVSKATGLDPDDRLVESDFTGPAQRITSIIKAMARQEQGASFNISDADINSAYNLFTQSILA